MMQLKKQFFNFNKLEIINEEKLNKYYSFSLKIVYILIALTFFISGIFYTMVTPNIIYWSVPLLLFLLLRFYGIYIYRKKPQQYTIQQWYIIYLVSAFVTAIFFSSLSFFFFPYMEQIYQFVTLVVLVGISSAMVIVFAGDYRLSLTYMGIIIVPLMAAVATMESPTNYILLNLLILYSIAYTVMIFKAYSHEVEFNTLRSNEDLLYHLFKEAPLGIFMYDSHMRLIESNEQFLTMFHRKREEMIGSNLYSFVDKKMSTVLEKALTESSQLYKGLYTTLAGDELWIEAKVYPYKNQLNNVVGGIVLIEDKTREKSIQDELTHMAKHDGLTGLLNRRGLYQYMEEMFSHHEHQKNYSLLFYLDLNQFKGINDSLGHSVGDAILLSVSKRLTYTLDRQCQISRLGGDEFIVIFPFISTNIEEAKKEASEFAIQIQKIFEEPFIIEDLYLHIMSSIGIILIEPDYQNIEEVIRHADITMYHAKTASNHISYYNERLDTQQKELFVLQHDLAYAVDKNEFDVFFQPIVKIRDEKLYAAESLIRWNHPERGLLAPNEFISLAIKAGLLSKITWWVLDQICSQIAEWKKFDLWKLDYVSINVNAQQLIENNFAEMFLDKLNHYGLETTDILVEITERSLIDNFDSTQDVITALRKRGVRCAIDDFGIGYSSLSYLKKLSFHTLKIDREFVKDIEENPKELLLVSTILDIGRQFNYNIVIEGVEDKKQKDLLLGLDEELSYQGYYFSKPLHGQAFREKYLYGLK